jgi:PAS domain S-box-containing protein
MKTEKEQVLSESELRERNNFLETLLESCPDYLYIYDIVEKKNLYSNKCVQRILGYSAQEIKDFGSQLIPMLMHPDDLKTYQNETLPQYKLAKDNEPIKTEYRMKHKNGTWRRLASRETIYLRNDDGTPRQISGILHDITHQKELESELRKSEKRYRTHFDHFPLAISVWQHVGEDFLLTDYNLAAEEITDGKVENILGISASELYAQEEAKHMFQTLDTCFKEQKTIQKEFEYLFVSNGKRSWLKGTWVFLEPDTVVLHIEDITERKRAEEELRQSEDRFRHLAENARDMVYRFSIPDESFEYISPASTEILGYSPQEIIDSPLILKEAFTPEYKEYFQEHWDLLLKGQILPTYEYQIVHGKTGQIKWINQRNTLTLNDKGQPVFFEAIVTDITDSKLRDKILEREQRIESLGVLSGGIAHSFNNILMGILGYAEVSKMELSEESQIRKYLDNIISSSMKARDLVTQLSTFSGGNHNHYENINVNSLIEEMTFLIKTHINGKGVVNFNLARNIPEIKADITQVRQILINLIINASEALEDNHGLITISTGVMEVHNEYLQSVFINKDVAMGYYTFIEISDTGCGMNQETQARMFDPFFSTKFPGRGLGLAATLGMIRENRGAIKVYSESGKGTTMKVLFPCIDYFSDKQREKEKKEPLFQGNGRSVLVVDDEETIRHLIRKTLEREGFRVLTAEDGRRGMEIFKENMNDIFLVILDKNIPYLSGEEVFRDIRIIKPNTKVLLSSGYNEEEATKNFTGKGLAGFIQKPYLPSHLLEKVSSLME